MTRFRRASQGFSRLWKAVSSGVLVVATVACADSRIEPPPAEGRGYPNLATVPRPPTAAPLAQRESEIQTLLETRDATLREDQQLRAIDPGRALPPPQARQQRAAAPAQPAPAPEAAAPLQPEAAPARPQAAAPVVRPELPTSLYMGSVAGGDRGAMAEIDRKVLADAVGMARRTNARIRLDGGRSAEERQRVVDELVRLGLPSARISVGATRGAAPAAERAAIDVFVEY